MCGALYCHNKRDGGGGKEANTAFRAASWKVKDCLILPQLAICAFRFTYFASSVSFWWLLHASEDIQEKKFKDKRAYNVHSTEIMCIAVMFKKSLKLL